ncbi:MAG: hypothetical protein AB203_02015 [Parcubacteria bacterium C7867-008]|nr:MAG: hypothetical protein AB203_02015 [Parcubacteria bacterium C7867-008]
MPNVTKAAGGIVLGDHGTIAMVRNRRGTVWFFPKGKVEPGETDEIAARREIEEETGLKNLELIDDLGSYQRPRILPEGGYDHAVIKDIHMYLFAAESHAELAPTMEIEKAIWVPLPRASESLEDAKDRAWFVTVFERVRLAIQRD